MYQSWKKVYGQTQSSGSGFIVPAAGFDKGFNFRATSGFVTDGANETYVIGDVYPTTRNGVTFGWINTTAVQTRDRDSGVDRRLAGLSWDENDQGFRIDLPSTGTYDIHLSVGDVSNPQTVAFIIKDDTTTLYTKGDTAVAAGHFLDANGIDLSTAAWPGSETANSLTFSSTGPTRLVIFSGSAAVRPITHIRVVKVG